MARQGDAMVDAGRVGRWLLAFFVVVVELAASTTARAAGKAPRSRCRDLGAQEMSSAAVLNEVAFCNLQFGDWAAALNAATRWLEHPNAAPERKRGIRKTFLPLAAKTARIVVDPPDARVIVDGQDRVAASGVLYVRPGAHAVVATAAKGSAAATLTLSAGETKMLVVETPPEPVAAPEPEVPSIPSNAVSTPEPAIPPPAPSSPAAAPVSFDREERRSVSAATIVLGSIAVAAAGAGGGLYFFARGEEERAALARKQAHEAGESCSGRGSPACTEAEDHSASARALQTAAIGSFAGALAFAVSTVVLHLTSGGTRGTRSSLRLDAVRTAGGGMLVAGGSL